MQLLHQYKSLSPSVFDDGKQQQLFEFSGTIPIGNICYTFNIPVVIRLPLDFPSNCPICYVVPAKGMKIKPKHPKVDSQDGRINHPYLEYWEAGQFTLGELVGLLCSAFGKDPPLCASTSKEDNDDSSNAFAYPSKLKQLIGKGFDEDKAREYLLQENGDMDSVLATFYFEDWPDMYQKSQDLPSQQNNKDDNLKRNDVKVWLCDELKLPQYSDLFMDDGFDEMDVIIASLGEADLKEMGDGKNKIKKGHRNKIMLSIKQMKEQRNKQSDSNHAGQKGTQPANGFLSLF